MTTKWLRKKKKLTQKQLAEKVGVAPYAVSNWESGRSSIPAEVVTELCKVLETSPNELFGWVNK